jgi:hypothetical protein
VPISRLHEGMFQKESWRPGLELLFFYTVEKRDSVAVFELLNMFADTRLGQVHRFGRASTPRLCNRMEDAQLIHINHECQLSIS